MRTLIRGVLFTVLAGVLACGGSDATAPSSTGPTGGTPTGTGGSNSNSITVGDNFFTPSATTVPVGTTVTWTWSTSTTHNVTFGDGTSSGNQSGGTYSMTFNKAGTYQYQCTIHAGMDGTITVQ